MSIQVCVPGVHSTLCINTNEITDFITKHCLFVYKDSHLWTLNILSLRMGVSKLNLVLEPAYHSFFHAPFLQCWRTLFTFCLGRSLTMFGQGCCVFLEDPCLPEKLTSPRPIEMFCLSCQFCWLTKRDL